MIRGHCHRCGKTQPVTIIHTPSRDEAGIAEVIVVAWCDGCGGIVERHTISWPALEYLTDEEATAEARAPYMDQDVAKEDGGA